MHISHNRPRVVVVVVVVVVRGQAVLAGYAGKEAYWLSHWAYLLCTTARILFTSGAAVLLKEAKSKHGRACLYVSVWDTSSDVKCSGWFNLIRNLPPRHFPFQLYSRSFGG